MRISYYYRAWAWDTNSGYSDGYSQASATTLLAGLNVVLWFCPNTIISGTTLPDREGTAQNGVITWGSNPAGVSVTVGGLESTAVTGTAGLEEPTPPDYVSKTPAEDLFTESTGENIPLFYPIFKMASDTTGWPIQVFWIAGAMVMAMLAGALAMMYLQSMLVAGFIAGGTLVVACSIGIVPWWVLYVYAFMAVTFIVYQRVVSV